MQAAWGTETLDPTYNEATTGSVLPASGPSVAAAATGYGRRQIQVVGGSSAVPGAAQGVAPAGNFAIGLVVFVFLLLVIMWVAHRYGEDGEFANLKATAYNVLFIAFVAMAGIPVFKVFFTWLAQRGVPLANHVAAWALAS
jgi:hypothetical protein